MPAIPDDENHLRILSSNIPELELRRILRGFTSAKLTEYYENRATPETFVRLFERYIDVYGLRGATEEEIFSQHPSEHALYRESSQMHALYQFCKVFFSWITVIDAYRSELVQLNGGKELESADFEGPFLSLFRENLTNFFLLMILISRKPDLRSKGQHALLEILPFGELKVGTRLQKRVPDLSELSFLQFYDYLANTLFAEVPLGDAGQKDRYFQTFYGMLVDPSQGKNLFSYDPDFATSPQLTRAGYCPASPVVRAYSLAVGRVLRSKKEEILPWLEQQDFVQRAQKWK